MTGQLPPWRYSPRDQTLHLMLKEIGEVEEACCTHSLLKAEWQDPGDREGPRCAGCILVWADTLASRHGETEPWWT